MSTFESIGGSCWPFPTLQHKWSISQNSSRRCSSVRFSSPAFSLLSVVFAIGSSVLSWIYCRCNRHVFVVDDSFRLETSGEKHELWQRPQSQCRRSTRSVNGSRMPRNGSIFMSDWNQVFEMKHLFSGHKTFYAPLHIFYRWARRAGDRRKLNHSPCTARCSRSLNHQGRDSFTCLYCLVLQQNIFDGSFSSSECIVDLFRNFFNYQTKRISTINDWEMRTWTSSARKISIRFMNNSWLSCWS